MIVRSLTVLTATTIATMPLYWSLPTGQAVVMIACGVIATMAAALAVRPERANVPLIVSGLALALSGFVWAESKLAMAVVLSAGYLIYSCGLTPRLKRWTVAAPRSMPVTTPVATEEQPIARAA